MKTFLTAIVLWAAVQTQAPAQSAPVDSQAVRDTFAVLTVTSPVAGVIVFLGDSSLGTVPVKVRNVNPGIHVLRYIYPGGRDWEHPALTDTVVVRSGEQIERTAVFPSYIRITSEPYGAAISVNDSMLGTTPYLLSSSSPLGGMILFSKEGCEPVRLPISGNEKEIHAVLKRTKGSDSLGNVKSPYLAQNQQEVSVPVIVSTGAAILAGASAAYFKVKADNYYQDYQASGDAAALSNVTKFDRFAGISLAVCQINLGFLVYYLLSH